MEPIVFQENEELFALTSQNTVSQYRSSLKQRSSNAEAAKNLLVQSSPSQGGLSPDSKTSKGGTSTSNQNMSPQAKKHIKLNVVKELQRKQSRRKSQFGIQLKRRKTMAVKKQVKRLDEEEDDYSGESHIEDNINQGNDKDKTLWQGKTSSVSPFRIVPMVDEVRKRTDMSRIEDQDDEDDDKYSHQFSDSGSVSQASQSPKENPQPTKVKNASPIVEQVKHQPSLKKRITSLPLDEEEHKQKIKDLEQRRSSIRISISKIEDTAKEQAQLKLPLPLSKFGLVPSVTNIDMNFERALIAHGDGGHLGSLPFLNLQQLQHEEDDVKHQKTPFFNKYDILNGGHSWDQAPALNQANTLGFVELDRVDDAIQDQLLDILASNKQRISKASPKLMKKFDSDNLVISKHLGGQNRNTEDLDQLSFSKSDQSKQSPEHHTFNEISNNLRVATLNSVDNERQTFESFDDQIIKRTQVRDTQYEDDKEQSSSSSVDGVNEEAKPLAKQTDQELNQSGKMSYSPRQNRVRSAKKVTMRKKFSEISQIAFKNQEQKYGSQEELKIQQQLRSGNQEEQVVQINQQEAKGLVQNKNQTESSLPKSNSETSVIKTESIQESRAALTVTQSNNNVSPPVDNPRKSIEGTEEHKESECSVLVIPVKSRSYDDVYLSLPYAKEIEQRETNNINFVVEPLSVKASKNLQIQTGDKGALLNHLPLRKEYSQPNMAQSEFNVDYLTPYSVLQSQIKTPNQLQPTGVLMVPSLKHQDEEVLQAQRSQNVLSTQNLSNNQSISQPQTLQQLNTQQLQLNLSSIAKAQGHIPPSQNPESIPKQDLLTSHTLGANLQRQPQKLKQRKKLSRSYQFQSSSNHFQNTSFSESNTSESVSSDEESKQQHSPNEQNYDRTEQEQINSLTTGNANNPVQTQSIPSLNLQAVHNHRLSQMKMKFKTDYNMELQVRQMKTVGAKETQLDEGAEQIEEGPETTFYQPRPRQSINYFQDIELMSGGDYSENQGRAPRKKKKGKKKKGKLLGDVSQTPIQDQKIQTQITKANGTSIESEVDESEMAERRKAMDGIGGSERLLLAKRKKSVWKIDQIKKEAKSLKKKAILTKVRSQEDKNLKLTKEVRSSPETQKRPEVRREWSQEEQEYEEDSASPGEKRPALRRLQDQSLSQHHRVSVDGGEDDEEEGDGLRTRTEDASSHLGEEEKQTVVYKLTTTRYMGMLNEEYNEDDLEIMKVNSERNLLQHKIKSVALKKAIFIGIATLLFIIDSEVSWAHSQNSNLAEYERVRMVVNVLRAFITVLIVLVTLLVVQKHYYHARLVRHRNLLPHDIPLIFNAKELPLFALESIISIVHLPPLVDELIISQNSASEDIGYAFIVLAFFVYFRLLSCLELLHHFSPLNTNKGRFVGSLSKTQITTSFLVKAWLKTYRWFLPSSIFVFLLCHAYLIYQIERNYFPTDCFSENRSELDLSFRNCLWFCVISFVTVGYGDYYPTTIPGRAVNTVIIIGGMISSATIIGLVHEHMQLSNEEYHVFKFIKTRRKEQLRRRIAAKLVQLLLQMQVQRCKEFAKANIRWKQNARVVALRNEIYLTVERWKEINQELYVTYRRDNINLSEMSHMRNIEEMLSGIVIKGASIWEQIKNEKLQRKMDIEKSFFRSKMEVAKIQSEMQQTNSRVASRSVGNLSVQYLKFKTQRLASLNLSKQYPSQPGSQSSRGHAKSVSGGYGRKKQGSGLSKKYSNELLSLSSQQSVVRGLAKKQEAPVPEINVTKLDKSLHKKHAQSMRQSPVRSPTKASAKLQVGPAIERSNTKAERKPHAGGGDLDQDIRFSLADNNYEYIESEIFTDSEISYEPPFSPGLPSQQLKHKSSFKSQPKSTTDHHKHGGGVASLNLKIQQVQKLQDPPDHPPRKSALRSDTHKSSSIKRTKTTAPGQNGKRGVTAFGGAGLDLILMQQINRQSSSIVNREFVIEEDFEEDLTTPLSRDKDHKQDFSDALNCHSSLQNINNTDSQSQFQGSEMIKRQMQGSQNDLSETISKSKSLRSRVKFSDEVPQAASFSRQTTSKRATASFPRTNLPSTFMRQMSRRLKTNDLSYNQVDLSNYKSEKSLIEAVNDLKFERVREQNSKLKFETCFPQVASQLEKELKHQSTKRSISSSASRKKGGSSLRRRRVDYLRSNFEIQKRIQTTKFYYKDRDKRGTGRHSSQPAQKQEHIFNSDSSSLYGHDSQGQEPPYQYQENSLKKEGRDSKRQKSPPNGRLREIAVEELKNYQPRGSDFVNAHSALKLGLAKGSPHSKIFVQTQQDSSDKQHESNNSPLRANNLTSTLNSQDKDESRFSLRKRSINLKVQIPPKKHQQFRNSAGQGEQDSDLQAQRMSQISSLGNQQNPGQPAQSSFKAHGQYLLPQSSSNNLLQGLNGGSNNFERQATNSSVKQPQPTSAMQYLSPNQQYFGLNLQAQFQQFQNNGYFSSSNNLLSLQSQFGGKSPIKFRKQNTAFSEQSAKEIQRMLEPIGSNGSGSQTNVLQLIQQHSDTLLKQSSEQLKKDNGQANHRVHQHQSHHQQQPYNFNSLASQMVAPTPQQDDKSLVNSPGLQTSVMNGGQNLLQLHKNASNNLHMNSESHYNSQPHLDYQRHDHPKRDSILSNSHNFSNFSASGANSQIFQRQVQDQPSPIYEQFRKDRHLQSNGKPQIKPIEILFTQLDDQDFEREQQFIKEQNSLTSENKQPNSVNGSNHQSYSASFQLNLQKVQLDPLEEEPIQQKLKPPPSPQTIEYQLRNKRLSQQKQKPAQIEVSKGQMRTHQVEHSPTTPVVHEGQREFNLLLMRQSFNRGLQAQSPSSLSPQIVNEPDEPPRLQFAVESQNKIDVEFVDQSLREDKDYRKSQSELASQGLLRKLSLKKSSRNLFEGMNTQRVQNHQQLAPKQQQSSQLQANAVSSQDANLVMSTTANTGPSFNQVGVTARFSIASSVNNPNNMAGVEPLKTQAAVKNNTNTQINDLKENILQENQTITDARNNLNNFDRKLELLKKQVRDKLAQNQSFNSQLTQSKAPDYN